MRAAFWTASAASVFLAATVSAQQPVLKLTATSVNVSEPGNAVRIDIARWSTDQERNLLTTALTPPPPALPAVPPPPAAESAPAAAAPAGAAARGGRGGATGAARGGAGARGGGAAGARGGRGGGGGGNAGPVDPIAAFTAAIGRAPTIGYVWTNEVTGYAIKYALRLPSDGGERIILATNRRIGANALSWTPVKGTPTPYEFTLLEVRLTSSGAGEAKASLTTNIALDNEAKIIALENYTAAPALFANVKRP
jgi:hypothetical protein